MTDTVTIPRADYERLVRIAEDAVGAHVAEEFRAKLAAPRAEALPSEFVERMRQGESLVRLWREHRGMSKTELANRSGVHRVNLYRIEKGDRDGNVRTFSKLAAALGITVDDLI